VFLVVPKIVVLKEMPGSTKTYAFRVLLVGALSIYLLACFKSSAFEFALVAVIVALVWLLGQVRNQTYWKNLLTGLIGVNVLAIVSMPYSGILLPYSKASGNGGYSPQVISREKQIVITKNLRRLGEGQNYIFNDEQWLLEKIPFSHGYNPLGNPLYWYVKNDPFLECLVVVTQKARKEVELKREYFTADNAFAADMMLGGGVIADMGRPTIDTNHFRDLLQRPDFKWQLNELNVGPNTASMRVTTNAAAFLIFNNVNHPGWNVYVNGKKAEMVRTNRIFQGVFLDGAGSYAVVFKFRPVLTITLILLPYIVLFLCLIASIQQIRSRVKLCAN